MLMRVLAVMTVAMLAAGRADAAPADTAPADAAGAHAAAYVWWEGESPAETNFPAQTWFTPQNEAEQSRLSGGAWLSHQGKRQAGSPEPFARYRIEVPASGTYHFWVRKFWKHGPFRWRFDQADWRNCGRDVALADSVELRTHVVANWVYLGSVELEQGQTTFELRLLAGAGEDQVAAFDAFLLTPTAFFPAGKLKPGEKTGLAEPGRFSFEPAPDPFAPTALLDLRSLNEPVAGAAGYVRRDGDRLRLASGAEVRFFAVNVSAETAAQSRQSIDYLARKLAKLGVNMVRHHSALWDAAQIERIDARALDNLQYLVAAMKRQGIYTHLSFYFPLWLDVKPEYGIEGFDTIQNRKPFGLIFFNERLQELHRGWIRQILTAPNPHGGTPLGQDPALAIVELVNEDSLFFWTFTQQNIPPVQWKKLEERFGGPILPAWDMTRDGIRAGGPKKLSQMQKQVRFLADVQRDFYDRSTRYLKEELGYGGLVVASNWITADPALLTPIERWTYRATDIIDKHGYFGGRHEGEGAAYSVRTGHTYQDRSGLDVPGALPVHMIQEAEYPSMISEISWPQPNRYRTEFAPLVAACAALQGIDTISLFAMGSNYVRDTGMGKFQLATPAVAMTFPASALLYRRGDIAEATPTFIERSEADLFSLTEPMLTEAQAIDELRRTGHEAGEEAAGAGRRLIRTAPPAPHVRPEMQNQLLRRGRTLIINSPRSKGAIGFLKEAGPLEIDGVKINCGNDYAVILITSLDDQPIASSKRVLVTAMTDDRPYGFAAEGGRITSLGQFPFTVADIDATVSLGWPGDAMIRMTVLDENGYPRGDGSTRLARDAIHTIFER